MHPLKTISLICWSILFVFQLSLLLPFYQVDLYWIALLVFPLILPINGLVKGKRYTYKWIGFLTLAYFCIGISELVSNPELKVYAAGTTLSSTVLFLTTVYYARYLGLQKADAKT
ncbi:MAG: DUF2069 domain-containing protein [Pseudomonadota bacterium]